jgi:ATP-dependent DNA helicase RecG
VVVQPKTKRAAVVKKAAHPSHLFEEEQVAKFREMPLQEQIRSMLPFELTGAQKRVIEEIFVDMEVASPMNRLVQGDVGSGKTAVAACAMLAAVRSGYQAALMAPTEILAEQHYRNLTNLFEPLGISVALLVGKLTKSAKDKALAATMTGSAKIAVGTHALIQEGVKFDRLGLAVVDEQHRFGVMQRAALREKGLGNPDILVMTATPIPRSLTMTLYGDLDLSVIDELPPGRRPIKTHWKQPFERDSVYSGVAKLLQEGRQAYFVCPMINENEKMSTQAATDLHYRLSEGPFKEFRVGLLHGQMKSQEKESVMDSFRAHELDILVSTTVIEVGVDVPNASVMVIEDANRFGLSQLHQLRGRVGRGEYQSYCILISDARSEGTQRRMDTMVETNDGFRISEVDLEIRGPGEIAGTRQHGNLDFKIADLVQDGRQLEVARQAAIKIVDLDPTLSSPENVRMLERVRERRERMALVAIS